jgi:hypothetical protein
VAEVACGPRIHDPHEIQKDTNARAKKYDPRFRDFRDYRVFVVGRFQAS